MAIVFVIFFRFYGLVIYFFSVIHFEIYLLTSKGC